MEGPRPATRRVVLLTCATLRDLLPEDRAVAECLRAEGVEVVAAVWDEAQLRDDDVAVVRSVWDYHQRADEFVAFLKRIPETVSLVNRATLLWNVDKRYMLELAARGVPIVPTVVVNRGWDGRGCAWAHVVIKPLVGASGEGVHAFRLPLGPKEERRVERMLAANRDGMLLQPYVRSIATVGELSAVFIDGVYLHCVKKVPPSGDFKVQGGKVASACIFAFFSLTPVQTIRDVALPEEARAVCDKALQAAVGGERLMYARVDLVLHEDRWLLGELELLDPQLFLDSPPLAAAFARAIRKLV
jgi:hypothetical protein